MSQSRLVAKHLLKDLPAISFFFNHGVDVMLLQIISHEAGTDIDLIDDIGSDHTADHIDRAED